MRSGSLTLNFSSWHYIMSKPIGVTFSALLLPRRHSKTSLALTSVRAEEPGKGSEYSVRTLLTLPFLPEHEKIKLVSKLSVECLSCLQEGEDR